MGRATTARLPSREGSLGVSDGGFAVDAELVRS